VVLFQPRDDGLAVPLGLLALGSWLTDQHVVIVDGRFELAPEARVVELAREAACLGVTVRTGAPLREARRVSAAARAASPRLPILWGGAHARLAPGSCLATGVVDACVCGAGEEPIAATLRAVEAGRPLSTVPGLRLPGSPAASAEPMLLPDPERVPRAQYGLVDLERHFEARGARRLDYCSSRGTRGEAGTPWSPLPAERVAAEVLELAERYRLSEVVFRDEDFFADRERAEEIAGRLFEAETGLAWCAGAEIEDVLAGTETLRLLRAGGCRQLLLRVPPGALYGGAGRARVGEAGSRLREVGLAGRFSFELSEPGRHRERLAAACSLARTLAALDGRFETPVRRVPALSPVDPGTELDGWMARAEAPWSDRRAERKLARIAFFFDVAQRTPGRRPRHFVLRLLALVRVRLGFFALDVDRLAAKASAMLRTGRPRALGPGD
jgi:anaerobic magnesium-protoporphyrin IX monomethyl ester cyclase